MEMYGNQVEESISMKVNKKPYIFIVILYCYLFWLYTDLNDKIELLSKSPMTTVLVQYGIYFFTSILIGIIFSYIAYCPKKKETLILDVLLLDIPSIWMLTLFIQLIYFSFYPVSFHLNWQNFSSLGAMIMGVEIFRYVRMLFIKK